MKAKYTQLLEDRDVRRWYDNKALGKKIFTRYRLKAFAEIAKNPGIYFSDLARKLGVERGLLAYHVGVLHAAGLVEQTLERRSKQISKYTVSEKGKRVLRELSSKSKRWKSHRLCR